MSTEESGVPVGELAARTAHPMTAKFEPSAHSVGTGWVVALVSESIFARLITHAQLQYLHAKQLLCSATPKLSLSHLRANQTGCTDSTPDTHTNIYIYIYIYESAAIGDGLLRANVSFL
jgi:hypothetical protein